MIPFNIPPHYGTEEQYLHAAIANRKLSGDGPFTKKCSAWLEERTGYHALLTPSCTHALEMAAILADICLGDYFAARYG